MSRFAEQSARIWAEVKENHARLDSCAAHNFVPEPKYPAQPNNPLKQYRCTKCGGKIDAIRYHWYFKGLCHGKAMAEKTPDLTISVKTSKPGPPGWGM
jgi:hypothetical protein